MIVIAHIGGVPVEETLLLLVSGLGAGLVVASSWVMSRVRRLLGRRDDGAGSSR